MRIEDDESPRLYRGHITNGHRSMNKLPIALNSIFFSGNFTSLSDHVHKSRSRHRGLRGLCESDTSTNGRDDSRI